MHNTTNPGFTLVELLLVLTLTSGVIMALVSVMSSGYIWPRFVIEQGAITTTARVQLNRISDTLRDGTVIMASPTRVDIMTSSGLVIFSLIGTKLYRGPSVGSLQVVARGIRNETAGLPLFTYFSLGGSRALELDPMLAAGNIDRVFIQLVIDNLPNQLPGQAVFETEVTVR